MAEQKQNGRRSKKGGDKKKQDNQPLKHKSNWTPERKARNVKRHLARDEKRAEKAKAANTPRGSERRERRRLARLAAVEQAAVAAPTTEAADSEQAPQPANDGYANTPLGHQLAAMDREAERAGLFPERE